MPKIPCDVCGAYIDTETGETTIPKNSTAFKLKCVMDKQAKLREEVATLKAENEKLKGFVNDNRDDTDDNDEERSPGLLDGIRRLFSDDEDE